MKVERYMRHAAPVQPPPERMIAIHLSEGEAADLKGVLLAVLEGDSGEAPEILQPGLRVLRGIADGLTREGVL